MNAEYRYFRSMSSCALTFSVFAALAVGDPNPKPDHRFDMPDMTLRTLETEWTESWSLRPRDLCDWLRKET